MSVKKLLFVVLVAFICAGCQKKPAEAAVPAQESPSPVPSATYPLPPEPEGTKTTSEPGVTVVDVVIDDTAPKTVEETTPRINVDFSLLDSIKLTDNTTFRAEAHKKYLADKLDFSHYFEQNNGNKDDYFIVGSDYCKLYPKDLLIFHGTDKASLNPEFKGDGKPVPLGTILRATGTTEGIRNVDKKYDYYDFFEFEDEYNYFYEVEWNGEAGIVYGADLGLWTDYGHSFGHDMLNYFSDMLKNDGILDYFVPLEGTINIPENTIEYLVQNRIVLQETDERWLHVDDLIDEYRDINDYTPMFITTDLASHSQHLIFDRLLQYTEETFFVPRIRDICSDFIAAVKERADVPDDIKVKALSYFQVPELILRTTPTYTFVRDGWMAEKKYVEPENINEMIQEYPVEVQADFKQIQEASGDHSVVFETREDFTQYKPRGHYTKNGVLEGYFKASMWFGRIHFAISEKDPESERMTPIALFIVDTVKKNPDLYKKWKEIFDPITTLIGESDDLGFPDILPLWSDQKVDDFKAWTENKSNFLSFMKLCNDKLKPPAISSNTVFLGFDGKEPITLEKPPMGWRFLGQRFTLDASFFQQLVHPEVKDRTNVRGLDIMRILGSPVAESFIAQNDYKEPEAGNLFAGGMALKKAHQRLKESADSLSADYWSKNYYNSILATVRAQATFCQGAGFYFTECPMWSMKSLISSHSTWAELKHDTILYVKQSYAEKGGGDDWDVTYRTKSIPKPINYIEPNLSFWELSLKSVKQLISTYATYRLLDEETERVLRSLFEMYSRIYDICGREVTDTAISEADNSWIRTIPSLLANYVMIHQDNGDIMEQDDLQMACIADVFTNADTGQCLEVGIGKPYKVYIPLNDGCGKRIAVGFIPSYHEFYQPTSNRLNDDQWKATVYNNFADMTPYRPFWSKSCILPTKR